MLSKRQNVVLVNTNNSPEWGASFTVLATPVGARVNTAGAASPIAVDAGHSFRVSDKFIVGTDTTRYREVSAVTTTSISYTGAAISVSVGDALVNLGPDTGVSTPLYDASPMEIYSDPDGSTAETNAQVTADALGNYVYYHKGSGKFWELIRNTAGTPQSVIQGFGSEAGRSNVVDFGARGNGTTDDAARIQATIDAAGAIGGLVFLPASTYNVLTPLEPVADVLLSGVGPDTVLHSSSAAGNNFFGGATRIAVNDWGVRDLRIDGRSDEKNNTVNTRGFHIGDSNRVLLENIVFQDIPGSAVNVDGTVGATNIRIHGCHIIRVSATNFSCEDLLGDVGGTGDGHGFIFDTCDRAIVQDNFIDITEFASIQFLGECDNCIVSGNRITNSGTIGIRLANPGTEHHVVNNFCDLASGDGIRDDADRSVIAGNVVTNGIGGSASGIQTDGKAGGIWANNIVYNNGGVGLFVANTNRATDGLVIQNNLSLNNTGRGIDVAPGAFDATDLVITGNLVLDNTGVGIRVQAAVLASTGDVSGNRAFNNTGGNYSFSATNWTYGAMLTEGALGVGNTVVNVNTPSGATARAMEVFDGTGTSLGFIPIYAAQW